MIGVRFMENFVIAVTRTCGSGATSISKMLAEKLGINVYDRNLLRLASDDSGINEELFAKADEHMKQSLLYKVSKKVYKGELIGPESDDFTSNENLFNYQAKVLKELAQNESYICIGRAADFVLKDNERLITVFFHAPMENRIKRAMELTGFDIPVAKNGIFWVEDYMTNDVNYNSGPQILGNSHSPIRYQDALKSAAYIGRLNDNKTYYEQYETKYLSLALGYELLFVRIIKQGLDPGDAVIVNLSYSQNGETDGSDWVPYQKALLVGPESGDASVVVALPPNAWKFEEETAWSANYTATNPIEKRKFENQQTATDNPVTFINTKKDKEQITVHDEANVENRMSPTS